jgi:hypothetical protein
MVATGHPDHMGAEPQYEDPGSPISVFYSPTEKKAMTKLEDKLYTHKMIEVKRGDRGTHEAKTQDIESKLEDVKAVARARSTMLSYTNTPIPVRARSLSVDQTTFFKKQKSDDEMAEEYRQWRRETSETDLFAMAGISKGGEDPLTMSSSTLNKPPGAYSRAYKMQELEDEDDEGDSDDEVRYYGIDSVNSARKAKPVFRDFKNVMGHIARNR